MWFFDIIMVWHVIKYSGMPNNGAQNLIIFSQFSNQSTRSFQITCKQARTQNDAYFFKHDLKTM